MMDYLYWVIFTAVVYALFMLPRVIYRLVKGEWPDAYWSQESRDAKLRDW
jgi:hypothetical protein